MTDDFLATYLNFAVVMQIRLADLERMKEYLAEHAKRMTYQRVSTNQLWITDEKPQG